MTDMPVTYICKCRRCGHIWAWQGGYALMCYCYCPECRSDEYSIIDTIVPELKEEEEARSSRKRRRKHA